MSQVDLFASDEDIIPETPVKIIKKKRKFRKEVTHSIIRRSSENLINNSCDSIKLNFCKKPYIFYDIKEILNFTISAAPLNNNFKTVGRFFECNSKHYLLEPTASIGTSSNIQAGSVALCSKFEEVLKLRIDLQVTNKVPKQNEVIEVFGQLDFLEGFEKLATLDPNPVIVVKFFRPSVGDIGKYVQVMKKVRKFAPKIALQLVNKNVSFNDWSYNETYNQDNSFFDDGAESFLVKHAEAVEVICSVTRGQLSAGDDSS